MVGANMQNSEVTIMNISYKIQITLRRKFDFLCIFVFTVKGQSKIVIPQHTVSDVTKLKKLGDIKTLLRNFQLETDR